MAKHPPKGAILQSIVNDRLDIRSALGELIDNAIDANARRVEIAVGPQKRGLPQWVRVEDDGDGCANLVDMVQLGSHADHRTTILGRFGIGAKNAMLWLGGIDSSVTIRSTATARTRRLTMAWKDYARDWDIDDSWFDESPAEDGARGTRIDIRSTIRRFPEGEALKRLEKDLGYLYSPAIKRGVQILIRRHAKGAEPLVLQRWELPPLIDVVDASIAVDGRSARVYVGIVQEGHANPRPGITYVHGFRVIKQNCALGCGGLDYSNVCGFVELDRAWNLTKNKDDVSQHQEELGEGVFAVLRELLQKAAARGQELQFSAFNAEVERVLNERLETAKAKRAQAGQEGAHTRKGTKRKQGRAAVEQDGKTFPRRVGGMRVSYQDLGDPELFGQQSEGFVILNLGNPFVASIRATRNVQAVALAALVVFVEGIRNEDTGGQRRMRYATTGDLVRDIGRVLARPSRMDGNDLVADAAE